MIYAQRWPSWDHRGKSYTKVYFRLYSQKIQIFKFWKLSIVCLSIKISILASYGGVDNKNDRVRNRKIVPLLLSLPPFRFTVLLYTFFIFYIVSKVTQTLLIFYFWLIQSFSIQNQLNCYSLPYRGHQIRVWT